MKMSLPDTWPDDCCPPDEDCCCAPSPTVTVSDPDFTCLPLTVAEAAGMVNVPVDLAASV